MGIDARVSHRRAFARLAGAQSGHPGRGASKRTREQFHFARCTAGKSCFERLAETGHAVALDQPLYGVPVWGEPADLPAVVAFTVVPDTKSFGKEALGIEDFGRRLRE